VFGRVRRQLGEIFHALARQKEGQILEGHLKPDRGHRVLRRSRNAHMHMSSGSCLGRYRGSIRGQARTCRL
jgi:hypothetical protein